MQSGPGRSLPLPGLFLSGAWIAERFAVWLRRERVGPAAALILLNLRVARRAPAEGQPPGSGNGNRLAGLGIGTRQREHEQRALLAVAQFDAAPMQLHDALHDQQAQPAILAAS